jgi:hypothetical protein
VVRVVALLLLVMLLQLVSQLRGNADSVIFLRRCDIY